MIALTCDGNVYGRGTNKHGELSLQHKNMQPEWKHISFFASTIVSSVQCGYAHSLFLTESCKVYTCGRNDYGQLVRYQYVYAIGKRQ